MKQLAVATFALALACSPGRGASGDATPSPTPTATPSPLPTPAGTTTEITGFGSNPGGLQMFLYDPGNLGAGAPIVVALHGCTQSAADYANAGWNALADADGFYVSYPQTLASTSCFAYWDPLEARRNMGEASSIVQMVTWTKTHRAIDPARVFVTGLSAGGGMTAVMAATYPDVFSGAAIMAGIPFRCADDFSTALSCASSPHPATAMQWGDLVRNADSSFTGRWPRISIWQGEADAQVVPANADELLLQWTNALGIDATADATETIGAATHTRYRGTGGDLVESWRIAGMDHGVAVDSTTSCGAPADYFLDAGVCSSRYAAKWFGLE